MDLSRNFYTWFIFADGVVGLDRNITLPTYLLRSLGTLLMFGNVNCALTDENAAEGDIGLVRHMDISSKYLMVLMATDDRWRSGTYIIV